MIISNITPPQVWSASARSLTNIGSGALTATSLVRSTLATSASVDLRPSAGTIGLITVSMQTGAAATAAVQVRHYDGTNTLISATSPASATANTAFTMINTAPVGALANNQDAANTGLYMWSGLVFTI